MTRPTIASTTATISTKSTSPITSPRRDFAGGATTDAEADCCAGQEALPCPADGADGA